MKKLKSKSFTPELTDKQIEDNYYSVKFISFESAIQLYRQAYDKMELKDSPKGYYITEQGISICY